MTNKFNEELTEDSIDFKKYFIKAIEKWYWFVISIVICVAGAYLNNRYTIPVYTVSSSIIVREKMSSDNGIEMIVQELGIRSRAKRKAVVENEISILKSYRYAERAINKLNFGITYMGHGYFKDVFLYKNVPFIVKLDSSRINKPGSKIIIENEENNIFSIYEEDKEDYAKKVRYGELYESKNINFTLEPNPKYTSFSYKKYSFSINSRNSLINKYRGKLSISVNDKKGSVLKLSMKGFNPEKEADYLNMLMIEYLNADLDDKNEQSKRTIEFIDEQIRQMQDSLRIAEDELQFYRSTKKIINLEDEGKQLYDKLRYADDQKNTLIIQRRFLDTLERYVNITNKDLIAPSIIGMNDQVLSELISEYNNLLRKKKTIQYSVSEFNPELRLINEQLKDTRGALISNLGNRRNNNRISIDQVNRKLRIINEQMEGLPLNEQQLVNIQRKFDLANNLYNFLLQKRAEQGIASTTNSPNHKILDFAIPQNRKKIKPNSKFILMTGFVFGLLIPIIIIVILDFFSRKIEMLKEIENKIIVPIIGNVETNIHDSNLPVYEYPKSSFAESFRSIRTQLQFMSENVSCPTILVSSAVSGEGKTFTAANLAVIYSMMGKKTLVLGLDLRKPKINELFDIKNNLGLSTYLIGKNTYEETIDPSKIQNLYIASSGPVPPNPAELIQGENMNLFFERAKKEFDVIIIDTPPFAVVADSLIIKDFVDVSLFVLRQGYTDKNVIKMINSIKENSSYDNVCVLVNDVKKSKLYGYGYKSTMNYQYGYEKGYYER